VGGIISDKLFERTHNPRLARCNMVAVMMFLCGVFLRFRDFTGPFVFHCHNIEHEDMSMMARFNVID